MRFLVANRHWTSVVYVFICSRGATRTALIRHQAYFSLGVRPRSVEMSSNSAPSNALEPRNIMSTQAADVVHNCRCCYNRA